MLRNPSLEVMKYITFTFLQSWDYGIISISLLQMGKLSTVKETNSPNTEKNATSKNGYSSSFYFMQFFSGPDGSHYLNFLSQLITSLQTKR